MKKALKTEKKIETGIAARKALSTLDLFSFVASSVFQASARIETEAKLKESGGSRGSREIAPKKKKPSMGCSERESALSIFSPYVSPLRVGHCQRPEKVDPIEDRVLRSRHDRRRPR